MCDDTGDTWVPGGVKGLGTSCDFFLRDTGAEDPVGGGGSGAGLLVPCIVPTIGGGGCVTTGVGLNTLTPLGNGGGATIVGVTWLIGGGGIVTALGKPTGGGGTIPVLNGIFGMAAVGSKTRGGSLVIGFKTGATGVNGLICTG